jgi:hypothetical protein
LASKSPVYSASSSRSILACTSF